MPRIRSHPGSILNEDYLRPLVSPPTLAAVIEVPANRISELVPREPGHDGRYFRTTSEFWMNLQVAHNLSKVERGAKGTPRRDQ